jgi:dihydrofolate synthase/folylpolyglutamate synthase
MNQKYSSILEQFFHTEKITDYSLDKIRSACEYFGNPQDTFKSIHIAWTNGKGSTTKMIFQILKESGKKVGVYTSPHLIDIRERFEVGNCILQEQNPPNPLYQGGMETWNWLISEEDFSRIAEQIIEYGHELSSFEKCVLLAFLYFREQGCEYAVIEVGMWWRLDATNIITPILSIITSISYDHMEFLGNTLEEIAFEKWWIIKPWIPVILYDENPVLEDIARERNSRMILPKKRNIHTNLTWEHQISNWRIAYEAWVFLGIPDSIIQDSLLCVDHHGRLEYILPNLLIDGAHNEDGMRKLHDYLSQFSQKSIIYCINLKKWKSMTLVTDIFPEISEWIIVRSWHQMVENAEILVQELREMGIEYIILSPSEIIFHAKENPEKLFVVFGSLYMVGDFLLQTQDP